MAEGTLTATRIVFLELKDERRMVREGYELLDEKRILLAAEILRALRGIYDRKTGAKVGQIPGSLGTRTVIAGQYLITMERLETDGSGNGPRDHADRKALNGWKVFDISDPAKPRQVNTRRNLLGYADPPADYVVKNYLAEFDPFLFAGTSKGTPSYFGTDLAGVVPHGNKLLIQSSAFLYCIGEK